MAEPPAHIPVLLRETLELLAPKSAEVAVDCTTGLGGHSEALARAVGPAGRVIGIDLDPHNLARAAARVQLLGVPFVPVRGNFAQAAQIMTGMGVRADVVLADLGFSTNQMEDRARGLSFSADGPLDMRLDPDAPITAADLVATASERELADIIYEFGEDPLARKIARIVAQNRKREPIRSTARLASLVLAAYGSRARSSRIHPATRTFMALRIALNDELGSLRRLLDAIVHGAEQAGAGGWMNPGARAAFISFHSLEDRLVKHTFADLAKRDLVTRLTSKPLTASEDEVRTNPRSRSAKLRAVRIDGPPHP